jgi:hypothetical protein
VFTPGSVRGERNRLYVDLWGVEYKIIAMLNSECASNDGNPIIIYSEQLIFVVMVMVMVKKACLGEGCRQQWHIVPFACPLLRQ